MFKLIFCIVNCQEQIFLCEFINDFAEKFSRHSTIRKRSDALKFKKLKQEGEYKATVDNTAIRNSSKFLKWTLFIYFYALLFIALPLAIASRRFVYFNFFQFFFKMLIGSFLCAFRLCAFYLSHITFFNADVFQTSLYYSENRKNLLLVDFFPVHEYGIGD